MSEAPDLHVMLDLETMGRSAPCAIVAIGAVHFDPWSDWIGQDEELHRFYTRIDLASNPPALPIDADTVLWWLRQDEAARAELTREADEMFTLEDAVWEFQAWLRSHTPADQLIVWAQGAAFDFPILRAAFKAVGHSDVPWHYYNERCARTMRKLAPNAILKRAGIKHHALDDCEHQARMVQAALRAVRVAAALSGDGSDRS